MSMPARLIARTALTASCLLCASAWGASTIDSAGASAKIRSIVDSAVRPVMAEHDVPGMSVGVTLDGKSYLFHYGVASKQSATPVTEATLFELGSVSKPMAATLASLAQVQGKLSLDDHPSKFMPQLKGAPIDKATLLHLGTYTAGGLPQQFPDDLADAQMATYFQQWQPDAAPGTQRRYSNPSLGLFGHLTALSMKGDFAALIQRQLFAPLGMKHSHYRVPASAMTDYAWGYDADNVQVRMRPDVLGGPTGGVTATASDVLRLVQANIDPSRLATPLRRAIEGTQVGYFEIGATVQGLGWEQYRYPVALAILVAGNSPAMSQKPNSATAIAAPQRPQQLTLFNKTGSTRGFSNYVAFVPQKKVGVVLLANKSYPAQARIKAALAILEQLAPADQ